MRYKVFMPLLCLSALMLSCNYESFEKRCMREAKEYTMKYCPKRMNDYTMMDSLTFDQTSNSLCYYYSLEGILDNDSIFSPDVTDTFTEQIKKELTNSVELKAYKEKDINFCYLYISKSTGKTLYRVNFTPEDYQAGTDK